ncbi:MAG: RsmB/NOP family class I SAM-dependent RNA methyltransferase, partial [Pseudomonadota bacterium]
LDLAFLPDVLPDLASSTDAALLPTGGLRLPSRKVEAIDGFEEGRWWVQDFAAQLPVTLLGDVKGKRVADLCAAPGGKTMQLAAAGTGVVAVEENEERARLIAENLARTRLADRVEVVVADARTLTGTFDAVLLDAPCSATGTLRRHPDVAYNKRAEDFGALAALQRTLLTHAATLLAPGGRLVFATCSLEPEEGERHLDGVLPEGLRLDPLREDDGVAFAFRTEAGAMRTRPDQPIPGPGGLVGLDGFFAARFVKV